MKNAMTKKSIIIKQLGSYTFSAYAAQFISVFGSILAKFFLGPINVGIWSALQLILEFSKYSGLGVNTVVNLDIPYYQSKGDSDRVSRIISSVFTFLCITSLIIGAGILLYVLFQKNNLSTEFYWGLIFVSFLIVVQRLNNFFVTLLRAFKKFGTASRQNIYSALVNVLLIGLLAAKFKIYGFLWATALSLIFNIAYIQWKEKYCLRFRIDKEVLKKTIGKGLPLMVIGIVETLFKSIDKIFVLRFLGFEAMGLYSIGLMAANYLNALHVSIAVVISPHLREKFGENDSRKDLNSYLSRALTGVSDLFPFLIALVWIVSPILTYKVLHSFYLGIPVLKIIVISIYFISLSNLCSSYLVAVNAQSRVLICLLVSGSFALLLCIGALRWEFGALGIAISMCAAYFVYFSFLLFYSLKETYRVPDGIKLYLWIMLKFLLMVACLFVLNAAVLGSELSWVRTLIAAAIIVLLSVPMLIKYNNDFPVLNTVWRRVARLCGAR